MFDKPEFKQDGAVYRLKFYNFMQYSDTEFILGPNLNVIIGPNGAGKSTIVNGICIGLAGKLSVLGRATSLADYVLVGQEEASIEIELHKTKGSNLIIKRKWNLAGRTLWTLDGKKTTEKEVKECVSKLRIQVDNLCQFLPQDKVHDFSRLNNKGLLDSTVDAVGNTDLKVKHLQLKELQTVLLSGDEVHERKLQLMEEKNKQCEKMQEDVQAYEEKKQLLEKFDMLSKKKLWAQFEDSRKVAFTSKQSYLEAKKKADESQNSVEPLKANVAKWKKMCQKSEAVIANETEVIKECTNKAKYQSRVIEEKNKEMEDLDQQVYSIQRRIKDKAATVETINKKIRDLEKEITESGEDQMIRPKLEQAKKETQQALRKLELQKQELATKKYEKNEVLADERRIEGEIRLLNSVDARKLSTLKDKSPQTYEAVQWLRNNKDQFKGEVYEPFIVSGNVINQKFAVYIENSIALKDLTIFFFENGDDMNTFLHQARNVMNLERVGAAQVPQEGADTFTARVAAKTLKPLGLVSYLKEIVQAPSPVLAYMCQQYQLHNTAVFEASSEKYNDQIAHEHGINKYFFGLKCQTVSRSSYSGKYSTRSNEIGPNKTLGVGIDQEKMSKMTSDMKRVQDAKKTSEMEITSIEQNVEQLSVELEGRRREHRELEQLKNLVAKNTSMIEVQRRHLRAAMSSEDEEREIVETKEKKKKALMDMIKTSDLLFKSIKESSRARINKEVKELTIFPTKKWIEDAEQRIETIRAEMKEIKSDAENKERILKESQALMMNALKVCKKETGLAKGTNDKPPPEFEEYCNKEGFPDRLIEIDALAAQLEARASCTDTVDQGVLEQYRALKEQVAELEQDILRRTKDKENQENEIDEIKNEWLEALNNLVGEINKRFSSFFNVMGFAGEVKLYTGAHENDFDNFGIKILVKYRDNQPLQELTAHHQSGGERSVATAIYMLALQALTTVPFRCVDEINQGMDARNERLVFDLLVNTSCEESNAQYFLLTPKLLPGLEYNAKMNVLIVHNGKEMCYHDEWNIDTFISNAAGS